MCAMNSRASSTVSGRTSSRPGVGDLHLLLGLLVMGLTSALALSWSNMHQPALYRRAFRSDIPVMSELVHRLLDSMQAEDLTPFANLAERHGWPLCMRRADGLTRRRALNSTSDSLDSWSSSWSGRQWFGWLIDGAAAVMAFLLVLVNWHRVDAAVVRSVNEEMILEVMPLTAWRLNAPDDYVKSDAGLSLLGQVLGLAAIESPLRPLS